MYALVRRDELEGVRFGGRGRWRVERIKLEEYLARAYDDTRRYIGQHPFPRRRRRHPSGRLMASDPVRRPSALATSTGYVPRPVWVSARRRSGPPLLRAGRFHE